MCVRNRLCAACACAFGVGVILTCLLPYGVLVCVQGVAILSLGVFAVCR